MSTKIEWAEETWNPVTGCSPVSAGCDNCYARRMATRLRGRCGYPADNPFKVTLHPDRLEQPLRWRKPRRIFVCSMGDLFHEDVRELYFLRIYEVMEKCPQHTFLLLTKRPELAKALLIKFEGRTWPLPNVWLGVTAENQETADERIPVLLRIPAAVRFVSVEPMLGPVALDAVCAATDGYMQKVKTLLDGIDWVICGGESGPRARPMHPDWARSLRDQCQAAGVPFFFKQWGEWMAEHRPSESVDLTKLQNNQSVSKASEGGHWLFTRLLSKVTGRLLDGREWNEYPEIGEGLPEFHYDPDSDHCRACLCPTCTYFWATDAGECVEGCELCGGKLWTSCIRYEPLEEAGES